MVDTDVCVEICEATMIAATPQKNRECRNVLIAATALSKGAVLETGNIQHYERIEGLQLEDWIRD